ncbi:MAG: archaellin/type IV pilin N-terminal domain-containing protein [archaeon]
MINKKGLSEVIAYVLLIVIALTLSAVVYTWMKGYLFVPSEVCPEGASIIIQDYDCSEFPKIQVLLNNHGRYNLDGFVIKGSNNSQGLVINPLEPIPNPNMFEGGFILVPDFRPGLSIKENFTYFELNSLSRIEISPIMYDEKSDNYIICEESVIVQQVGGCPP